MQSFILIVLALTAGLIAGLLGIGGGVIVTPALMFIFGSPHEAIATSLASMVITTGCSSLLHLFKKNISYQLIAKLSLGLIGGSLLGGALVRFTPPSLLTIIFGVVEILIGLNLIVGNIRRPKSQPSPNSFAFFFTLGFVTGFIASIMGIGGSIIVVSVLMINNFPIMQILGVGNLSSFIVTLTGTLPMLPLVNWKAFSILAPLSTISALMGIQLANKVPRTILRKGFGFFLIITGTCMYFLKG